MKNKIQTTLLLLVAAGILYFLYERYFPNEEKVIRQRLAKLAEVASVPDRPTVTGNLAAADRLRDFLSPDIEIEVDVPGEGRQTMQGRGEIVQAVVAARTQLKGLKVALFDIHVTLDPGQETATAELTLRATHSGDKDFFVQELKLKLRKEDRLWRVWRAETMKTLSQ
ncbi:MAG: nuclear transport factor 2 family protein [Verrucomicrobia bacterium]|nr:nuclear transport factor 2 family protein [Verrucomicrobiota bacterium]